MVSITYAGGKGLNNWCATLQTKHKVNVEHKIRTIFPLLNPRAFIFLSRGAYPVFTRLAFIRKSLVNPRTIYHTQILHQAVLQLHPLASFWPPPLPETWLLERALMSL